MNPAEQLYPKRDSTSVLSARRDGVGSCRACRRSGRIRRWRKMWIAVAFESAAGGMVPAIPHHVPKAKRAIYLFMSGAPSQIDMYDYKPKMAELFDSELPDEIRKGQRLTTMTSEQKRFPIAPSIFKFKKYDNGGDGKWVSELLPHTAKVVGEMAFVKSVFTEAINHDPAITYICTGNQLPGRASLGAWLSYGLGSENKDLPAFVVLNSTWTGRKEAQALFQSLVGKRVSALATPRRAVAERR